MIGLVGLLACEDLPPPPSIADYADPGDTDAAPADTGWGPAAPDWDAAEVSARLATLATLGIPEPGAITTAYEEILAHGEPECPLFEDGLDHEGTDGFWAQDDRVCTTADGYSFAGLATYALDCEGSALELEVLASWELGTPTGETFVGGGNLHESCTYAGDDVACTAMVGGSYAWPGREGWLGAGADASLDLDVAWSGGARTVGARGGVGIGGVYVSFDELVLDDAGCVGGGLLVRDPSGWWHTLAMDGRCDGCGALSWRGEALGEACVDLVGWFLPLDGIAAPCAEAR